MNRKSIIAIAFASAIAGHAVAGTSLAGDISVESQPFAATQARAVVQAELAQYKQSGVNPWSISYNPLRGFESTKSRDQVTAEFMSSRDRVAAFTSEDSGSAYLARSDAHRNVQVIAGK